MATVRSVSAGIVLVRPGPQILLVHPGGPFWAKKDEHGWSIPKGELDPDGGGVLEDGETAAVREFAEELGQPVPDGERIALPPFRAGKKQIVAWLIHGELDVSEIASNEIEIEWPPRSGKMMMIPEVDRAEWVDLDDAERKLHKGQAPIVEMIRQALQ